MEMLAASEMNLRGIFAAGWREGESGGGEGGGCRFRMRGRNKIAFFPASKSGRHGEVTGIILGKQGEGNMPRNGGQKRSISDCCHSNGSG